jgi:hypothetical protein
MSRSVGGGLRSIVLSQHDAKGASVEMAKWIGISFLVMLALGLARPAAAQVQLQLNDPQAPGSVLVFHKFISGTVSVDDVVTSRTEIEISVTCPAGSEPCEEGTEIKLTAHWVCPASQLFEDKQICQEVSFNLFTTVKGTIVFGPGAGSPEPPCPEGYLIVWVVDEFDRAIKYDALIGNAVIRHRAGSAGAYNAVPIQAVDRLATGAVIPLVNGTLIFDGVIAYKALTGKVVGSVRFERPPSEPPSPPTGEIQTFLTLLTLDVRPNRPNNPTFVDLDFFNQHEELISTSWEFICWTQVRLTTIHKSLDEVSQGSQKGSFESTSAEKLPFFGVDDTVGQVPLLGTIETQELSTPPAEGGVGVIRREYSYQSFRSGSPIGGGFGSTTCSDRMDIILKFCRFACRIPEGERGNLECYQACVTVMCDGF